MGSEFNEVDEADIKSLMEQDEDYILGLIDNRASSIQRAIEMRHFHQLRILLRSMHVISEAWHRIRLSKH